MPRRVLAMMMFFFTMVTLLVLSSFLAAAAVEPSEEPFSNSDSEAAFDGTCWFVDSAGNGCLMSSCLEPDTVCCTVQSDAAPVIVPVTDWPVDQVLYWDGCLLVSAGTRLLTLAPASGAILDSLQFEQPVERFAVSRDGRYVLTGGAVFFLHDGKQTRLVSEAARFWLEDSDKLCYMNDEALIHTLLLSAGTVSDAPNPASELGNVMVPTTATKGHGLIGIRQKFPAGKYWNHMPQLGSGMRYNNQDGWTEIPCPKHNDYCGTSKQSCNGYAPDGVEISYQCWGYADKLGYDVSGYDPQKHGEKGGWEKIYTRSSLSKLKAGDIVRYNKNGNSTYAHSVYVTAVNGDTVTYSDCNYDGTCVIRWDQTISLSTLRSWFVFLLKAPAKATGGESVCLRVGALLDGDPASSTEGWAVFDVKLDGKRVAKGVTSFSQVVLLGKSYEICNIKPASGILCDEDASLSLSGELEADTAPVLSLDHYYVNEAGEKIKTTLNDLPKQSHWSYRPICWALEQGIANGVSDTSFAPSGDCTRAQIVTFLWAFAGRPKPTGKALPFQDVKRKSYYYQAILWAVEEGITAGRSEDCFAPDACCTRGEVVTFLYTMAGKQTLEAEAGAEQKTSACPFRDVRKKDFFYRPVLWAVRAGISSGTGPETFSPKLVCSRAEILTFLRALSLWLPVETPAESE